MAASAALSCAFVYAAIYIIDYGFLSWQCLNRPIVVGPIIGIALGDPVTGIIMGASLEAIFMGISAVGLHSIRLPLGNNHRSLLCHIGGRQRCG